MHAATVRAIRQATAKVAAEQLAATHVPIGKRKDWLKSQGARDHRDNVETALREVSGIDPETPEEEIDPIGWLGKPIEPRQLAIIIEAVLRR